VSDLYDSANILRSKLIRNVELGDCYYNNGTYNPYNNEVTYEYNINGNKLNLLREKYLNEGNNTKFIGIIDDNELSLILNNFTSICPCVLIRPSQNYDDALEEDGFSCYSTLTFGFDGVIEAMDSYLRVIETLTEEEIFNQQKNELYPVPGRFVYNLIAENKLDLALRFLKEKKVYKTDYSFLARSIKNFIARNSENREVLAIYQEMAHLVYPNLKADETYILERCL